MTTTATLRDTPDQRAEPCRIVVEPARPLTLARKASVLRAALAAAPDATMLRGNLVDQLMTLERFDEVLDLIAQWPGGEDSFRARRRRSPGSPHGCRRRKRSVCFARCKALAVP